MTSPRLIAIELEGFRGFVKHQRVSLDADAVLIRGDNGSGKTSLVDGFLWLFCGELAYLGERVKKLRRSEDPAQSRFTDIPARVALVVEHQGQRYTFERRREQKTTLLSAEHDGNAIPDPEAMLANVFGHPTLSSLQAAVLTWGLLRQDAVRAALDAAGGALYERLAGMVGLEAVSGFAGETTALTKSLLAERTALRKATKAIRERHEDALDRHRLAQHDLTVNSSDDSLRIGLAEACKRLRPGLLIETPDTAHLAEFEDGLASIVGALDDLLSRRRTLTERQTAKAFGLEEAEQEFVAAQQQMADATKQGPTALRVAQAALEALDGDVCPVCGQSVDGPSLQRHLQEVVGAASDLALAAQQASDRLAQASSRLSAAREQERQRHQLEEQDRLATSATAQSFEAIPYLQIDASMLGETDTVVEIGRELRELLNKVRSLSRAALAATDAYVRRLDDEAVALGVERTTAEQQLKKLEARYDRSKMLERATHLGAEKIVAHALSQIEPSFAEVFDRLNPNPAFTELRARQDVLRNVNQVVPVVHDPQRGIEANPMLVFSEGQLNVVALSYFLGMALNARELALPFLILDDPLQSLDTISALGFGDLCRRIRDQRQLLITTHDRRFADILTRKLSPREPGNTTIIHDFDGWTREGPSIRTATPEMAEVISLIQRRAS